MKIWGHRGASGYAPENTMAAFLLAVEQGADGIETDIHLTKDGVCVLMHDESLDRTTDAKGYIKDHTYEQLCHINANNGMQQYGFCPLPRLEELLALAKETNIFLDLEIKTDVFFYDGIEEKVASLVRAYGLEKQVMYSSFNHYSLMKMRKIEPKAVLGVLYMEAIYQPWYYASALKMDALHPDYRFVALDDYIAQAHRFGLRVHPWTVNQQEEMIALKKAGVDALITNDIPLAKSCLTI